MSQGERDKKSGQYTPDFAKLCKCGHPLGAHDAGGNLSERCCHVCDCEGFEMMKRKKNPSEHDAPEYYCSRCGEHLRPAGTFWLELDASDATWHKVGDVPEGKSQGEFPFGLECAQEAMRGNTAPPKKLSSARDGRRGQEVPEAKRKGFKTMRPTKTARKKNPITSHELKQAIKLYKAFRDDDAEEIVSVLVSMPRAAIAIGHVDYVGYTTTHARKVVKYQHDFKTGSKPVLAASADGKQLLLLGGRYTFTELGIVDINAQGKLVIPKNHGK